MAYSQAGPSSFPHLPQLSSNELLLGRELLQVQQERDALAAELAQLKLERSQSTPKITTDQEELLTIPPPLVPVLALLRNHITNLTRDNEALRYTFLGPPIRSNSTSPEASGHIGGSSWSRNKDGDERGVDLEEVLHRVKDLVRENEELGEMVLEAGRTKEGDWQKTLDQSAAIITSLDADLEHHLTVVQALQAKLNLYEVHYGSLPSVGPNTGSTMEKPRREPNLVSGAKARMVSAESRPSKERLGDKDQDTSQPATKRDSTVGRTSNRGSGDTGFPSQRGGRGRGGNKGTNGVARGK